MGRPPRVGLPRCCKCKISINKPGYCASCAKEYRKIWTQTHKTCCGCKRDDTPIYSSGYCKSCAAERNKIWRQANRDKYRILHRNCARRWFKTEKGKAASARGRKNQAAKRPMYNAVKSALRSGKLVKPERCSSCGEVKPLDAYHEDCSKFLEVTWLCRMCKCLLVYSK